MDDYKPLIQKESQCEAADACCCSAQVKFVHAVTGDGPVKLLFTALCCSQKGSAKNIWLSLERVFNRPAA